MRVGMVVYEMYEFGGLEDIATTLAIALQQKGHQASVVSTGWIPADNQYKRLLTQHSIAVVHPPRWLARLGCDWPTKERVTNHLLWLLSPLVYLLALGQVLVRRGSWSGSVARVQNWLRHLLLQHVIGPDRRQLLTRLLLNWWRLRWRPDLLHIHGYTDGFLFILDWAAAVRMPTVYEEHQTPDATFDWWQGFAQRINRASVIIAVSAKSAEALRTVCQVERPILTMTPIVADPMANGWHASDKLPDAPVTVITIARLYVTKGLDYLLEAIQIVRRTYPTTQFRVYGSGPLREELLARAAELGLDGEQIFVGTFSRQELSQVMAASDMLVMSSILEGLPVTLIEAMAYGLPIVATAVGGVPEVIRDGESGLLCPPRDAQQLADKIMQLIADPEKRLCLGQAARTAYQQGAYHPQVVGDRFLEAYELAIRTADF